MSNTNAGGSLTRLTASPPSGSAPANRATTRALASVEHRTIVGLAEIQSQGMLQAEKVQEVDRLAREATTGQAMLAQFASVLALLTLVVAGSALIAYLLGFHLGQTTYVGEAVRIRREAAEARRAMADLTRTAFLAMAEAAERQHRR